MTNYKITSFTGTYNHTLDAKGRFSIPSNYREILRTQYTEELMIFQSIGYNYLLAYPFDVWKTFEVKVSKLNPFDPVEREVRRIVLSTVKYCPLDKAGRILLPPEHRKHAEIEKEVTIRGDLSGFEIWSTANWIEVSESIKNNPEVIKCAAKIFAE
ncbi:MAG: division/cell wall cluster transcriptional repressor MraZ [Candidatus Schekmanbacteria bacterium]|nr:MAG: division/cell wall cluster transcriptional repressor MraZ [Candidatus Schekmanbacteria bacterium]